MTHTVYTIEMAHAHMRQLQELANRSRAHQPAAAYRIDRDSVRLARRAAKKR
ncbi:hypothetical protein [Streptomyces sp. NPDC059828]|uniref:hypothetical protein n=1 Tax=Streptomyces sp. NPDC059828 TaxID=3346965 RepID=UPI0036507D59